MSASCRSDFADEADDAGTDAADLASSAVQHSMGLTTRQGQAGKC